MLLFEILAAAWFFAFGAVIGSFLNVVVWRTPRGESMMGPSRCPQCRAAIRWYNNVPVFGWIWLGGKCRDCKVPISPRYPLVEFICGAMFLAVALAELASGGANLPGVSPPRTRGLVNMMLDTNWELVRIYALQMLLLCALLAWGLMQVDEQRVPRVQIFALWIIGFVAAFMWSPIAAPERDSRPVSEDRVSYPWMDPWLDPLYYLIGFFVGGGIAAPIALFLHWFTFRGKQVGGNGWMLFAALTSVGLFQGVESVTTVFLLACAIRIVSWLASFLLAPLRTVPFTLDIYSACVIQICLWKYVTISIAP